MTSFRLQFKLVSNLSLGIVLWGQITNITRSWHRIRKEAGLKNCRLHDLNHSFASFLVNSGRSLYEVQQALGHSNQVTTQGYAHLSTKSLQDASNTASDFIEDAMKDAY